jgi:hypothetical protein
MSNTPISLPPEKDDFRLPSAYYSDLTDGAKHYFECAVREYADKLLSESTNIEKMEHAGIGAPEITAAHVEEAKWVLIRRLRRFAGSSRKVTFVRIMQTIMAAIVGVGASNFAQIWGAVICLVGILTGSVLLVVEREITREI